MAVHGRSPVALAEAAVHSYVVAFWVAAGIFVGSAIACALVLAPGVLAPATAETAPVVA